MEGDVFHICGMSLGNVLTVVLPYRLANSCSQNSDAIGLRLRGKPRMPSADTPSLDIVSLLDSAGHHIVAQSPTMLP